MTGPSFLAFSGEPPRLKQWLLSLVPGRHAPPRLNRAFDSADLVLFTSPSTSLVTLEEERGVVVGRLYGNGDPAEPVGALNLSESRHAAWSGGRSLLSAKWGNYVAFLRDEGTVTVLRDPSAAIPVYHCDAGGVRAFFSHAEVAADLGLDACEVDEEFLRQWLTYPYLRTVRTGLAGVGELLPGTAATCRDGQSTTVPLWTPWIAAAPGRQIVDFEEGARRLRQTILGTVPPQLRDVDMPVLELSGGLDSSIVGACLAAAGLNFQAANFVTRMSDGDERDYARIVAAALKVPLAELHEDALPLDLAPAGERALRPALSPVLQPLNRAFSAFAQTCGSGSFVTGAGGDNIFCYLTTASPVLDAAKDMGLRQAFSTLRDVAELAGCTIWTAGRVAFRKHRGRARRPRWKRDERFLAGPARAGEPDPHPWLDGPADARPGKIEHVDSLVRAQHFLDPRYPGGEVLFHPLISQPLMELCLAIPTWLWLRGGRNWAVARAAFAGLLPEEILLRRTKGRLESMCARAYAANREALAGLLLDGELATRGLLDLTALEAYLRAPGPPRGEAYFRVFDLASLELWLRSGRRKPAP